MFGLEGCVADDDGGKMTGGSAAYIMFRTSPPLGIFGLRKARELHDYQLSSVAHAKQLVATLLLIELLFS